MGWQSYRKHLEENAKRPVPNPAAPTGLSSEQHRRVLRSLQKFQLGESGEGRIAHEIDHVRWPAVDDDFRQLVKLWVREEGRHARILGLMVMALGGRVLQRDWSARGFELARRAMGPAWKLLIALAAEVAGMVFYRLLAEAMPGQGLSPALSQMSADEQVHLEFQSELFRRLGARLWTRLAVRAAWLFCGGGACLVVLIEHSGTLASLGMPRRRLFAELGSALWDVWRRLNVGGEAPSPLAQQPS